MKTDPTTLPAVGSQVDRGVGRLEPERADAGDEWAWEECEDWPEDDEPRSAPEFGCCLPPGECCMPGLHLPSECHTAADYQRRGR